MQLSDDGFPECFMKSSGYGFPWCSECRYEQECEERHWELAREYAEGGYE